ncbi:glycoside hydrolase family 28 protein [Microbacter margulisiae]|uniref:Polygalacturonase n=1 Tax=Microbacter margulisiae TaxID=1350067 RepID=A0A7W5DS09_9PORP|nr:glycoside hydrolase family 28 protein [Microbacter margulisiae]MBB3188006.1 polygalacturonase [Microbacter margulisiae]
MKCVKLAVLIMLLVISRTTVAQTTQEEVNAKLQNLPFASFSVHVPTFPNKQYKVTDFGAIGDALTDCTKAINEAIEICSEKGGGIVIIPSGVYMTSQIIMQSNVNLHLNTGAMIVFSPNINDYPLVRNGSGYGINPLIYGTKLHNVAITGRGSIDGNGQYWRPVKKEKMTLDQWNRLVKSGGVVDAKGITWFPNQQAAEGQSYLSSKKKNELTEADYQKVKGFLRPKMLSLEHCTNVLIEGVTLKNPPNFNMIMRSINGLVIHDVKVMDDWWMQNGDGLDLGNCKNVLMFDCFVNSGDDGICMKSSRTKNGDYGLENIVIKDCSVFHAHGGFVIGSNTDGNMRNIYVNNCSYTGTDTGLRFKSNIGRGGEVDHIYIDSIFMKDIANEAIIFDLKYDDNAAVKNKGAIAEQGFVPDFTNININHVICDGAKTAFLINGSGISMVHQITISNSIFLTDKGIISTLSNDITLDHCKFFVKKKPSMILDHSQNWTLNHCSFHQGKGIVMRLVSPATTKIMLHNTLIQPSEIEYGDGAKSDIVSITQ